MRLAPMTALAATALIAAASLTGVAQADTVSSPPRAAAPNCDWSPRTNGPGSMRTDKPIRLRTGPAAVCDWIGWTDMPTGQKLWAWCKTVNSSHNTWYFVRPDVDGWDAGWIYSGNVDGVSSGIPTC
ncbi:hypothetical protein GCM10022254_55020 [Actinomadura meridiana]|uniref:SH3 domain-containing protein n=1 Tax=Actinomadura meridiana TaxID=559626 RepID=A0ABP8CFJ0_9ACTN